MIIVHFQQISGFAVILPALNLATLKMMVKKDTTTVELNMLSSTRL